MDFSRIPFNSALDQLGQLSTIGTFLRLQTVVPCFQKASELLVRRRFYSITIKRESPAFLSVTFSKPENTDNLDFTVDFDSPEAILNSGPVECEKLFLYRADGVPVEAITCRQEVWLALAPPAILPFLACGAHLVSFWDGIPSETSVTLAAVMANLGAEVEHLKVTSVAFSDADDISKLKLKQHRKSLFREFQMTVPSFEYLVKWLQRNVDFIAHGTLCECVTLGCYGKGNRPEDWKEVLNAAVQPFCQQSSPIGYRHRNKVLKVYVFKVLHEFYFSPARFGCEAF